MDNIENRTHEIHATGRSWGKSLMQSLKENHYQQPTTPIIINVNIHGELKTFTGTINEGGMVKAGYWFRHRNALAKEIAKSGWELTGIFDKKTMKPL